jgi:hypothetical protein
VVKPRVDICKLDRMLRAGKPVKQCAKYFNVTPGAISQHKKNLNIAVVKNVALENAHRAVEKSLNTIEQLQKINKQANRLLDDLEQKPEMKLKIMGEIRGQLKLQLEIFQTFYNMQTIQEFQMEVLSIIKSINKEAGDAIIRRLQEKQALRSAIKIN